MPPRRFSISVWVMRPVSPATPVRAEPLEELGAPGPGDLELAERRPVEQRDGLPARAVLGTDGRRPVAPRPPARAHRRDRPPASLTASQRACSHPAVSPKTAPRAACQSWTGEVRSGPARRRLVVGMAHAVAPVAGLPRPRERCAAGCGTPRRSAARPSTRGRAAARPRRSTRPSPVRRRPPRRARAPFRPAATNRPAHGRLPQARLAVRRAGLRTADEPAPEPRARRRARAGRPPPRSPRSRPGPPPAGGR